jgi:hypothetical protein
MFCPIGFWTKKFYMKLVLINERKKTRQNGDFHGKIFDERFGGRQNQPEEKF